MKASAAALVLLITYALTQSNAIAQVPLQERNTLIALYNSTDGPNWVNNTGWPGAEGTSRRIFSTTSIAPSRSFFRMPLSA